MDYKTIADNDPGGSIDYAHQQLKQLSVTKYKTLNGNELRIWASKFPAEYGNIKAVAANDVVAEMTLELFKTPNSALDLNNTDIQSMMNGFVAAGLISAEGKAALEDMASYEEFPYAGVEFTNFEKARKLRQDGKI